MTDRRWPPVVATALALVGVAAFVAGGAYMAAWLALAVVALSIGLAVLYRATGGRG